MTAENSIEEIKGLRDDLAKTWEQTKSVLDAQDGEIAKYGEAAGETKQIVEKLNTRLDEIETKLTRPAPSMDGGDPEDAYTKAFWHAARHGEKNLTPDQAKTLSANSNAAGGFLVPEQWANELLQTVAEYSPVRQFATVTKISTGDALNIPSKTGHAAGGWVTELGTRSESTNPTFGMERIPVHEGYLMIDISRQLLEDSVYNLEADMAMEFADQQAVLEGAAHVAGNSVGQPEGILTNASISYTASGAASTITADGLISIVHDLKSKYLADAVWGMERATLKAVRQLKDGDGQYLWTPGFGTTLKDGLAPTILGHPYFTAEDWTSIATDAFPMAFGSFKAGYRIVDRVDLMVTRDDLTQAASGKVRFTGRFRTGGQVVLPEAIRKLKCATS